MSEMTPEQKIKAIILARVALYQEAPVPEFTDSNIEDLWDAMDEEDPDSIQEAKYEIREGEVETNLPCEWSRHYESKSVAAKAPDGSWVGWTYWYGGGKHAEPEAIDWMGQAYNLNCVEEQKMVTIQTFTKIEG